MSPTATALFHRRVPFVSAPTRLETLSLTLPMKHANTRSTTSASRHGSPRNHSHYAPVAGKNSVRCLPTRQTYQTLKTTSVAAAAPAQLKFRTTIHQHHSVRRQTAQTLERNCRERPFRRQHAMFPLNHNVDIQGVLQKRTVLRVLHSCRAGTLTESYSRGRVKCFHSFYVAHALPWL